MYVFAREVRIHKGVHYHYPYLISTCESALLENSITRKIKRILIVDQAIAVCLIFHMRTMAFRLVFVRNIHYRFII